MQRLYLFISTIPWGARLQTLAVLVILGFNAWIDINLGIWPVTIGIVLFSFVLGRLLLPVMMAHQSATFRIWGAFGISFLLVYVLAQNQWWWRTMAAHFGRQFFMWLDLCCGYWFISEVRLQQMRAVELVRAYEKESYDELDAPIEPPVSKSIPKSGGDDSHRNYYGEQFDS